MLQTKGRLREVARTRTAYVALKQLAEIAKYARTGVGNASNRKTASSKTWILLVAGRKAGVFVALMVSFVF